MNINDCIVSIIVPVYNTEKYLSKCLDSLCNQTYDNLEIIVIDDGSTDNSLNIINNYAAKDKRVKVYHKDNGGLTSAVSCGVKMSSGKYIVFVDSDDYVDKDYVEKFCSNIGECDVLAMGFYYQRQNDAIAFGLLNNKVYNKSDLNKIQEDFICSRSMGMSQKLFVARWNKIYKAELVKDIIDLYTEINLSSNEDSYFTYLIINKAASIKTISSVNGYRYSIDNASMTRTNKDIDTFKRDINALLNASYIIESRLNTSCLIHYDLIVLKIWEYLTCYKKSLSPKVAKNQFKQLFADDIVKDSLKKMRYSKFNLKGKIKLFLLRKNACRVLYKLISA